jgi:hypothetical protein
MFGTVRSIQQVGGAVKMPYKLSSDKKAVMVKRGNRWVVLKAHGSAAEAKRHLAALQINVEGHGTKRRRK